MELHYRPAPCYVLNTLFMDDALVSSFGNTTYNINLDSLIQAITPDHRLGRVGACRLFIGWGVLPLGALVGGAVASVIGVRQTLLLAGLGPLPCLIWVLFGSLWKVKQTPTMSDAGEAV